MVLFYILNDWMDMAEDMNIQADRIYNNPDKKIIKKVTWNKLPDAGEQYSCELPIECRSYDHLMFKAWYMKKTANFGFLLLWKNEIIIRYDKKNHPHTVKGTNGDYLDGPHKHIGFDKFGNNYRLFKVNDINEKNVVTAMGDFFRELKIINEGGEIHAPAKVGNYKPLTDYVTE